MKIKVTQSILDYEGKPLTTADTDRKNEDGTHPDRDFLVRDAIVTSLNTMINNEELSAIDKIKIFRLTMRVSGKPEVELSNHELTFIEDRAGKILTSLAFGRLMEVLEPNSNGEKGSKTEV